MPTAAITSSIEVAAKPLSSTEASATSRIRSLVSAPLRGVSCISLVSIERACSDSRSFRSAPSGYLTPSCATMIAPPVDEPESGKALTVAGQHSGEYHFRLIRRCGASPQAITGIDKEEAPALEGHRRTAPGRQSPAGKEDCATGTLENVLGRTP